MPGSTIGETCGRRKAVSPVSPFSIADSDTAAARAVREVRMHHYSTITTNSHFLDSRQQQRSRRPARRGGMKEHQLLSFCRRRNCRPRQIFQRASMSYNQHDDRGRPNDGRDRDRDRAYRRTPPRSDHSSYPPASSRYPRDDSTTSTPRFSSAEPPSPVIIVRNLAHELDDGEVRACLCPSLPE